MNNPTDRPAGSTLYEPGAAVRYVGQAADIVHGAEGTVVRMHEVLTDCPVVHFPRGTIGPDDTFVITLPASELVVVSR